jgi:hypothetical protein
MRMIIDWLGGRVAGRLSPRHTWFRICGYGLSVKDVRKAKHVFFSDRTLSGLSIRVETSRWAYIARVLMPTHSNDENGPMPPTVLHEAHFWPSSEMHATAIALVGLLRAGRVQDARELYAEAVARCSHAFCKEGTCNDEVFATQLRAEAAVFGVQLQ